MDPRHLFADQRLTGICVYCGRRPDTRDHVPSRVFIDEPMPPNVPVVEACASCNQAFSLDEEYLACLLECVLRGTVDAEHLHRDKIKRILTEKPFLRARLAESQRSAQDGSATWVVDEARVRNVVLKLARGHAAYELTLPQLDEPARVVAVPLASMLQSEGEGFQRAGTADVRGWPEIGSRAFLRACEAMPNANQNAGWVVVQDGRYRYSVHEHDAVVVQMVLSEYLACEVEWE